MNLKAWLEKRSRPPALMGILNVTPDSFYDGGDLQSVQQAVDRAGQMIESDVDIIDIGGESTRPGAPEVAEADEIKRVIPAVEAIRDVYPEVPISVDSSKATVAREALTAGANWINDVTGMGGDPDMCDLAIEFDCPVVIMHMQGTPRVMQQDPRYDDVVEEIRTFFEQKLAWATDRGLSEQNLIFDPGIGFGKTVEHNRRLLNETERYRINEIPLLIGHSRKSFLGESLGLEADQRLIGTLGVSSELMCQRVDILRVHDVEEHDQLRTVLAWLREGKLEKRRT